MTDFGDFEPAAAFAVAPPAPEQVARTFAALEAGRWSDLDDGERVAVFAALLAWLHRQGPG